MNMLHDGPLAKAAEALGYHRPTAWERLTRLDWQDVSRLGRHLPEAADWRAPSRRLLALADRADLRGLVRRVPSVELDATSLILGVVLGAGLGYGLAMALVAGAPSVERARRRAQRAIEHAEERVPGRLSITRVEEPS